MHTPRPPTPALETATYPSDRRDVDHWVTWKSTDDDRKVPRAPYAYPEWPDRYVNAQNPAVWTAFETAREWVDKLSGFALAYVIRDRDDYPDEDLVVIDYDDARDPDTGAIHPVVHEHVQSVDSYADISPSGTGVHILCRGRLPDAVTTIADALPDHDAFPDASIEVYDSARFVAMSGRHLVGTPSETQAAQDFIDDLVGDYATPQSHAASSPEVPPPRPPSPDRTQPPATTDVEDVYHAIEATRPSDIRLDSPVTETRTDGTKSRDPCWTNSETGTRLAEMDDGWIYRDGLIVLDALQVVALEEGIVTTAGDYPSGRDFWRAVDELRIRGATIPEYEPEPNDDTNTAAPTETAASPSQRVLRQTLTQKTLERDHLREKATSLTTTLTRLLSDQ